MAIIVNYSGNGFAYVDDNNPEPNQLVTLYANPSAGETLEDITAVDSGGHYIALSVATEQSFRYNSAWGLMTIDVTFSGTTPPTPPANVPIWLLFKIKESNICRT